MPIGVLSSYFACFQHFSYFCSDFLCLLCKDSEKLVHFGSFNKILFLYIYVCYRTRAYGAYLRKFSGLTNSIKKESMKKYEKP